jgi:hypothetical protein
VRVRPANRHLGVEVRAESELVARKIRQLMFYSLQNRPSGFINCGNNIRTIEHPSVGKRTYSYESANHSFLKGFSPGTNVLWPI